MRSLSTLATLLLGLAVVFWAPAAKAHCPHGKSTTHEHCAVEPPVTRIVFLTSATFKGDLGNTLGCVDADGLDRADCICNELADAAGLGTNFAAWLSTSTGNPATEGDPATDFFRSPVAYFRIDGAKVVTNWDDLVDGTILHPIEVDEQGGHPGFGSRVWTGTTDDGTAHLGGLGNCLNWGSMSSANTGATGLNSTVAGGWTLADGPQCHNDGHLYCFEQE